MLLKKEKPDGKDSLESQNSRPVVDSDRAGQPALIFDVAKPGTLPPANATARPVIVSNRAVMHDPMMVPSSTDAVTPAHELSASLTTKITIQPLPDQARAPDKALPEPIKIQLDTDADGIIDMASTEVLPSSKIGTTEVTPEPIVPSQTSSTPASNLQAGVSQSGPLQSNVLPKEDTSNPRGADDVINDKDDDEFGGGQPKLDKEAAELEASAKIQDEIDTLVDQKAYFLPINTVERRRSKQVAIVGLLVILVLGMLLVDIAMDAGFVTIPGLKPLTHLFTN